LNTNDLIVLQKKIDDLVDEILPKERVFYSGIICNLKGGISRFLQRGVSAGKRDQMVKKIFF
jgi:hypothetical protein